MVYKAEPVVLIMHFKADVVIRSHFSSLFISSSSLLFY